MTAEVPVGSGRTDDGSGGGSDEVLTAVADAPLDGHKLAAARLWAAHRYPYLASAVFASPAVSAPGLGRVVIDRWWRIHADPTTVAASEVADLGAELLHLASHVLRDHADRADRVGLSDADELHHWVDAADAEIADDFPHDLAGLRVRPSPADLDLPTGRLAEEYYRTGSVRDPDDGEDLRDCGSGAHGRPPPWEPPPPDPDDDGAGIDGRDADAIRRRVAADILGADPSTVGAGLRTWARRTIEGSVDWRTELAAVLRRAQATVAGAVDYSYRRPSRRAAAVRGVILPALRRPAVDVAVVCDTSASVSDELLAVAVVEIDGIVRAAGTRAVTVLACDDAVQATTRVVAPDDLVLIGGGGTDLGVGLGAAAELTPRPDLVVVVTDGFTPWPEGPPTAPVVVALLPTDDGLPAPPPPPPWTTTVAIGR